jgi:lipopolysaccharide export system permease protein
MSLLDKYLIGKFLFILIFAIITFAAIFLVVDLIENIDKFIDNEVKFGIVLVYYLFYIPYIISLTLPVSVLLSCLFSLGNMSQHNEIVAQKSAGISLYRLFSPLFILGFIISIIAGLFNETVVPWTNQKRYDIYRYQVKGNFHNLSKNRNNINIQDIPNRKVIISFFNGTKNEALNVSLQYFKGPNLTKRIDAKKMIWIDESWQLIDVVKRSIIDSLEIKTNYEKLIVQDLLFKPENLLELQKKPEEMSYSELKIFISEMSKIGTEIKKWILELYLKISYPFANFIIMLFGAPIAAQKRRSGTAIGIGISLLVCFIYFIFIRTGQVLGHQGNLSPWLGAWFGNIIFGIAGFYTLFKARK